MTTLQPAWVLSRRPYGDSGFLVELFTGDDGRCGAVVRGAHRKKTGGSLSSVLQPFGPIVVSLAGKGDLKTLRAAESVSPGYALRGDVLLAGLYLNELLTRLLPRFDPYPQLFLTYGDALERLAQGIVEPVLRRLEFSLLAALGYRIDWAFDQRGDPLADDQRYRFEPGSGFCLETDLGRTSPQALTGAELRRVGKWLESEQWTESDMPQAGGLKHVSRVAMSQLTAGKPLNSRDLFKALKPPV